ISRTPRDPDPDGTVGVSPCQGDGGRRLRAASRKRGAPIPGCGISALYLAQSHQHKIFCNPLTHKYLSHLTRLSTNRFSRVPVPFWKRGVPFVLSPIRNPKKIPVGHSWPAFCRLIPLSDLLSIQLRRDAGHSWPALLNMSTPASSKVPPCLLAMLLAGCATYRISIPAYPLHPPAPALDRFTAGAAKTEITPPPPPPQNQNPPRPPPPPGAAPPPPAAAPGGTGPASTRVPSTSTTASAI